MHYITEHKQHRPHLEACHRLSSPPDQSAICCRLPQEVRALSPQAVLGEVASTDQGNSLEEEAMSQLSGQREGEHTGPAKGT